jgi:hypothetical protein
MQDETLFFFLKKTIKIFLSITLPEKCLFLIKKKTFLTIHFPPMKKKRKKEREANRL